MTTIYIEVEIGCRGPACYECHAVGCTKTAEYPRHDIHFCDIFDAALAEDERGSVLRCDECTDAERRAKVRQ